MIHHRIQLREREMVRRMKIREIARITSIGGRPISYWTQGIETIFAMQRFQWESALDEMRTFYRIEMLEESERIRNYDTPLMLPEGRSYANHE